MKDFKIKKTSCKITAKRSLLAINSIVWPYKIMNRQKELLLKNYFN